MIPAADTGIIILPVSTSLRTEARRLAAPIRVARARVAARRGPAALVAVSVAVAAALLLGVQGGASAASQQTVSRTIAALAPEARAIRLVAVGTPGSGAGADLDPRATAALHRLTPAPLVRTALLPLSRIGGTTISPAAIDGVGRWVTLRSGRLPERCDPQLCEVIRVAGETPKQLAGPGIRLQVVGEGVLSSALPFGSADNVGASAGNRKTAPLLLAGDVAGLLSIPAFSSAYRTLGWVAPLQPDSIRPWQIAGLLERSAEAQSSLAATGVDFRLTAPERQLVAARSASTAAERRLQLVGGEAAALLLAFLLLTAFTIRRGLTAEWERLERRGARRSQLWLFALTESAAVTLPGVAVGWLLAVVSTAVIAHWASLPVRATLSDSLLTWPAAGLALAGWAIATLVLLAALRPPAVVRVGPLQAADLLAAGALAALLLAAGRSSSTAALAAEPDPLLAMLPVLVALLAALLIGRLLPPLLRLAGRRSGGLPLAGRLAVITLARAPGRAAAAAAFLVVSLGLALFAASYRQTLVQGQRDQADFAVPVAAIASSGARLVPPLEAAPAARFAALPGIGQALPVDRIPATAPSSGGPPAAVDVIGVPPGGLDSISWRERPTGAQGDLSAGQARLRGVPLPAGARRLSMRVQPAGRVDVSLSLRTPAGGFVSVSLTGPAAELAAPIPAAAQGGQLIALRVTRRAAGALSEEHQGAEGSGSTGQAGALRLGPLRSDAGSVTGWQGFVARGVLASPRAAGGGVVVRYALVGGTGGVLRPAQATDGRPIPVIVSPDLAGRAAGDLVQLSLPGRQLAARIVGVAERFPTVPAGRGFAVADGTTLETALNADAPGTAVPSEVWLAGAGGDGLGRALRAPPFDVLDVRVHDEELRRLEADPLARGAEITLLAAAALGMALAIGGLLLTTQGGVTDERSTLYDLEAQGVAPATLRRQIRLRSALVAVLGAIGGLAMGLVLAHFTVQLVTISAGAEPPDPPLRGAGATLLLAAMLAVYAAGSAVAVLLPTARALREPAPLRPTGDLP